MTGIAYLSLSWLALTDEAVEKDFPHFVDIVVTLGGLSKRLDAMYAFHTRQGIKPQRGHGRRDENGRDIIRWCFADPKLAEAFASEFNELRTI